MTAQDERASLAIRRRMRELEDMSQPALARAVGRAQSWVSMRLLGEPDKTIRHLLYKEEDVLDRLLKALRWSRQQFADETKLEIPGLVPTTPLPDSDEIAALNDFVLEPVRGEVYAGFGVDFGDEANVLDEELVPRKLWRRGMQVVCVKGNSMAPTFHVGDRLYVDTTDLEMHEGKVYLVHVHGNGVLVKRAQFFEAEDSWFLVSDNSKYLPLRPDQATVFGRVYYRQPQGSEV